MVSAKVADTAAVWGDNTHPHFLLGSAGDAALALLALGSAFLLAAGLFGFPRWVGSAELLRNALPLVLILVGMLFHFVAWLALFFRTWWDPSHGLSTRGRWSTPKRVLLLSVLAFVGSAFATPCLVFGWCDPASPFYVIFPPLILFLPYTPAVFAPVALCHAYIFRVYARRELPLPTRRFVGIGIAWLALISFIGILGQIAYSMGAFQGLDATLGSDAAALIFRLIFLPFPAGLTAIGYGIAFVAWRWNASRWAASTSS